MLGVGKYGEIVVVNNRKEKIVNNLKVLDFKCFRKVEVIVLQFKIEY